VPNMGRCVFHEILSRSDAQLNQIFFAFPKNVV
jgi:hypothetical protein